MFIAPFPTFVNYILFVGIYLSSGAGRTPVGNALIIGKKGYGYFLGLDLKSGDLTCTLRNGLQGFTVSRGIVALPADRCGVASGSRSGDGGAPHRTVHLNTPVVLLFHR